MDPFGAEDHMFGGGDSFFGSHFRQAHHHEEVDHNGYSYARGHQEGGGGSRCRTVTQRVGNMITTYTQCS